MKDKVYSVRLTRHQMRVLHNLLDSQEKLTPELREIDNRLYQHLYVLGRMEEEKENGK